ncbi:MAG: ParA family protein [Thermodesulfobacteriota bacterium]
MSDNSSINKILERSQAVLTGEPSPERSQKFKTYAISNFRGGIGKSTLAFNLAYEISRKYSVLLLDTCSQRNLSQNIFGDDLYDLKPTLYDALVAEIAGSGKLDTSDLVTSVKPFCQAFTGSKPSFMVPGSTELFLFPSLLYSQLAQFSQLTGGHSSGASSRVLLSIKHIVEEIIKLHDSDKVLIDTSPFFGGATHLAWEAAEALIIPVRVDQHSIEALDLTLNMLGNEDMDFQKFNSQANLKHKPKVHAIAMTHCGWNRQRANTPDSSTKFFVESALAIAKKYEHLFSENDVAECFYLLDDFHSSGRISGKQRIPLSKLVSGRKFTIDGQRLEVNPSVDRYKKEMKNLMEAL